MTEDGQRGQSPAAGEDLLRTAVQATRDAIIAIDEAGLIVLFNPAAEKMFGRLPAQVLGQPLDELMPAEYRVACRDYLESYFSTGKPDSAIGRVVELPAMRSDGTSFFMEISLSPCERDGRHFVVGVARDITERTRAATALRQSQQWLAGMLASLREAVFIIDTKSDRVIDCNPAACSMFGYGRDELIGPLDQVRTRVHVDASAIKEFLEQLYRSSDQKGYLGGLEFYMKRKDGTIFPTERSVTPILDKDGGTIGWLSVVRDMTEHNRLEAELRKIQKLESVGVLAGGIAHDFNNLLTGILGNITLAHMYAPAEAIDLRSVLKDAERASLRARELTQQLLTFSRGGAPIKKACSLAELLVDTTTFVLRGAKSRPSFAIAGDLWPAHADAGQCSQVIHNIVLNADQAMPQGGTIEITAQNVMLDDLGDASLPAGPYIRIGIRDEGIGIPPEHLGKVFDPFFTTKQRGSGLGLATTYSIVKAHGGHISVASTPGLGSTFYFYLPALPTGRPDGPPAPMPLAAGHGRILLMDDEELVRETACRALTLLGYEVECVEEGNGAVECYRRAREAGQPFDLVLLDLTVPGGVGGAEAMRRLREIDPQVKGLVSSGYANDPIMAEFAAYGFSGVIAKPWELENLQAVISDQLSSFSGQPSATGPTLPVDG